MKKGNGIPYAGDRALVIRKLSLIDGSKCKIPTGVVTCLSDPRRSVWGWLENKIDWPSSDPEGVWVATECLLKLDPDIDAELGSEQLAEALIREYKNGN